MITSQNKSNGFFGTLRLNYGVSTTQAARLFDDAASQIVRMSDAPSYVVSMFLDSTYGRHFSDTLSFSLSQDQINSLNNEDPIDLENTLRNAITKELATNKRHLKEFQRFVREFQAEETSEFGESKFNKLVQRVLETKG